METIPFHVYRERCLKKKNKIWKMEIWEEAPDLEERIPASNFEEIE